MLPARRGRQGESASDRSGQGARGRAAPRQIIALFRDLSGPHTLEVVRGVVDAADESRVDAVTGTTGHRSISQWLEGCVALDAAGLILVISLLAEDDQRRIVEQRLPVELVDPPRGARSRPSPTSCRRVLLPPLA